MRTNPAPAFTPGDVGERFDWQAVLSELWFPLWASLRRVFGYSCWEYLNHVGLWFTGELGLGGWVGLGGLGLGCEGCAYEDGG